jgi:hypothetical protein
MAVTMDRVIKVYHSFAAADRADEDHYASLAPEKRVDILLDLIAQYRESLGETASRLERVCRVTDLSQS